MLTLATRLSKTTNHLTLPHNHNKLVSRHINAWGMRAVVGVVLVAGMFLARRWSPLQRRRIKKRLRKPLPMSNFAVIERPEEEQRLRNYLSNTPLGPVVVVGPEGCGKSNLIKKVLSGRMMSVFLDLRAGTVMSGDELVVAFIQQSGYLLPSTDQLSSMLLKGDKKNKISGQELNAALDIMQEVLSGEKLSGWKNGIPVICIDHVHSLGSSVDLDPKKPKVSDDPSFLRLIDWVIAVTDQKLAHILFTTTTAFAALDLDRNTSFRERRTLFHVHFIPNDQAKAFLASTFSAQLPESKQLSESEISTVVNSVGGHLRDLETVIDYLHRGDSYVKALRKLVTENVQYLVSYMETLLENYFKDGKDKDAKSKKESCESYIRFWELMEHLRDHELVDRRQIISEIFKEKPKEIDNYFVAGIVRSEPPPQPTEEPPPQPTEEPPSRPAEEPPHPTEEPQQPKNSEPVLVAVTTKADPILVTTVTAVPTDQKLLLCEQMYVAAGSPRMRMCFKVVLQDPHALEQKADIVKYLKKQKLKDKEKEWDEKRNFWLAELKQVDGMIRHSVQWREVVGADNFSKKVDQALTAETQTLDLLRNAEEELSQVRSELDKL